MCVSIGNGQFVVLSTNAVFSVHECPTEPVVKSKRPSYDYAGNIVSTVANIVQNTPIKIHVGMAPYFKGTYCVARTMAEDGVFDDDFTGLAFAGLAFSINSNATMYKDKPAEMLAMDAVDGAACVGGMMATAFLVGAGVGLAPIIGAGLIIGGLGYLTKLGVDYAFKKFS